MARKKKEELESPATPVDVSASDIGEAIESIEVLAKLSKKPVKLSGKPILVNGNPFVEVSYEGAKYLLHKVNGFYIV